MEVIGEIDRDEFICKVSKHEIEKFMNLYYNKMPAMKVGDSIDLGAGYDFAMQARDAMQATNKFIEENQQVIKAIMEGIKVIGLMEEESDDQSSTA